MGMGFDGRKIRENAQHANEINFPSKHCDLTKKLLHWKILLMIVIYTKVKQFHEVFEKLICFHQTL